MRAMYNVSLCYSLGTGFSQNHRHSRKWMKRAADHGHRKAQFEHGLSLFSVINSNNNSPFIKPFSWLSSFVKVQIHEFSPFYFL